MADNAWEKQDARQEPSFKNDVRMILDSDKLYKLGPLTV